MRKERDKEIELVIQRLEADMSSAKEECERAAENRWGGRREPAESSIPVLFSLGLVPPTRAPDTLWGFAAQAPPAWPPEPPLHVSCPCLLRVRGHGERARHCAGRCSSQMPAARARDGAAGGDKRPPLPWHAAGCAPLLAPAGEASLGMSERCGNGQPSPRQTSGLGSGSETTLNTARKHPAPPVGPILRRLRCRGRCCSLEGAGDAPGGAAAPG